MLLFALGFPLLLLLLLLFMDWIEAPVRSEAAADLLPAMVEQSAPDDLEDYVRDNLKSVLDRHWLRQRVVRLLPGR